MKILTRDVLFAPITTNVILAFRWPFRNLDRGNDASKSTSSETKFNQKLFECELGSLNQNH